MCFFNREVSFSSVPLYLSLEIGAHRDLTEFRIVLTLISFAFWWEVAQTLWVVVGTGDAVSEILNS